MQKERPNNELLFEIKKPFFMRWFLVIISLLMLISFYTRNIRLLRYIFFDEPYFLYEESDFYYSELGGLVLYIIGLTIIIYLAIRFIYPSWNLRLFQDKLLITMRLEGTGSPPYNHFTGLPHPLVSPLKMRFKKKIIMLEDIKEIYTNVFPPDNKIARGYFIFMQHDGRWFYFYIEKAEPYSKLLYQLINLFGPTWDQLLANSKFNAYG